MRPLRPYEIACCALFAGALCAAGFADARAPHRLQAGVPQDVRAIVVTHLPDDISTRTQLSLERLRQSPDARRVTLVRPAEIREAVASLETRSPSNLRTYDARWEFIVLRRDGGRTHVSCNAFGTVGAYDGAPVRLRLERLVRELKRRYPVLQGTRSAPVSRS